MAFNFLLSIYAEAGKNDEVYRVWNRYKPLDGVETTQFYTMIISLSKLDGIADEGMSFFWSMIICVMEA